MQRAGHEGLRRNAATAMGNRGEARHAEPLARALAADPSPVVRRHAAWALGEIGGETARAALAAALAGEPDAAVRDEVTASLARLTPSKPPPILVRPEFSGS
jgi:epoxyqueuosine reductase